MGIRLVTPPTVEPISLVEIKDALRVDHSNDDAVLTAHIKSAREWIERRTQSKMANATWELIIDAFPEAEIMLPMRPVVSVSNIKYDNLSGVEVTYPPASYELDNTSTDPWVFTLDAWPVALDTFNAVRIQFVVGYASAALMPPSLYAALILKVKELYDGDDTAESVHNLLTNHYSICA